MRGSCLYKSESMRGLGTCGTMGMQRTRTVQAVAMRRTRTMRAVVARRIRIMRAVAMRRTRTMRGDLLEETRGLGDTENRRAPSVFILAAPVLSCFGAQAWQRGFAPLT